MLLIIKYFSSLILDSRTAVWVGFFDL